MRNFIIGFVIVNTVLGFSCLNNQSHHAEDNMKNKFDTTVHDIKDDNGRLIEKWGNFYTDDQNTNFRYFFKYDSVGNLVEERRFFLEDDNSLCVIKDTSIYDYLKYSYIQKENEFVLYKEECTIPNFDTTGKYVGRKLYYIYDHLEKKYEYHDSGKPSN